MGSATSSPLSLACTIVPTVYFVVKGRLRRREASALEQLKARAPHILKPSKNPAQLAHESNAQRRKMMVAFIIIVIILSITILTSEVPQYMKWSFFFDTQANTHLYNSFREVGLATIGISALVLFAYHLAYLARVSYVSRYWNISRDIDMSRTGVEFLYAQRDDELDLQSLSAGIFWLVRDPETFSLRLFFMGTVLSSCSWLLLLIFGIITILIQPVVVQRDILWEQLYGPVYHTYRAARGGQFYCTCLNASEARLENRMRRKQQELVQVTPATIATATLRPPQDQV